MSSNPKISILLRQFSTLRSERAIHSIDWPGRDDGASPTWPRYWTASLRPLGIQLKFQIPIDFHSWRGVYVAASSC